MKNIKLIIAALVSFAALSCEKESLPQSTPESDLLPLVITTGDATKTYIADNGKDIHWHSGDKIKVYSDISIVGDVAQSYDFTMPDGFSPTGNYAKFEGKVVVGTNKVWAVYPSELASGATDTGVLQVKLPATQNPYNGGTHSFSQNLNISVATAPVKLEYEIGDVATQRPVVSENMTFYNTCALVKFTIPSGITNIKNVTVSTDQDIVGDMTIDYSGTIPAFGGIANGSKSISMTAAETFADGRDYYFVLAPVAISEISIFVNTTDNKQYAATRTFSTPLQLNAGEYKSLGNLNLTNMPSFGVDFDIQDDNGYLNGTDVIFTFPNDNVSNLKLTVSKDGTIVRNIDVSQPKLNDSNKYVSSCLNETVEGWPYLPKGTYTVSGTYDTEGGAASVNNITFEINTDPNFTVGSFDAYTSYTKYQSGAVGVANGLSGSSIYVTASNVGISENILKNSNYIGLIKVEFATRPASNYGSVNLDNGIAATLTNQQYGEYKSPSYIFDGKSIPFAGVSCDVTGIPYSLSKKSNDSTNKWEGKGNGDVFSWTGSNGMVLGPLAGAITVAKSFWIPTSINVSVSTSGNITNGEVRTKTGKITVGSTPITNTSAKAWKSASFNVSQSAELTSTYQTVQINLSDATLTFMTVNSLTIDYAN